MTSRRATRKEYQEAFANGELDVAECTTEPTTSEPTGNPTAAPTSNPTASPNASPTTNPTRNPTANPTANSTANPTANPITEPTSTPTPFLTDGSAGALSCGSTVTGDTSNAEHNVGSVSGERWYTLEVPATRPYVFSTCDGASWDIRLRLFNGSHLAADSVELANVDDSCGLQSRIERVLEPGSYTVVVEGYTSEEGAYTLGVACGNAPSSGALSCGSSFTGSTVDAVHVVGTESGEHFYRLAVPVAQQYTFSTCGGSSNYDTRLRLYSGDHFANSSTELDNVDDSCGLQTEIVRVLAPGSYTLVVEGFVSHEGTYTLATSCVAPPTVAPTSNPTANPTANPTTNPTINPTAQPTAQPTAEPTAEPTTFPSISPTLSPMGQNEVFKLTVGFAGDYTTLVANGSVADFEASLLRSLARRTIETVIINAETSQVMTQAGSIVATVSFLETSGMTATEARRLAASFTSSPLVVTTNQQQFASSSAAVAAGTLSPSVSPTSNPTSQPTANPTTGATDALGSAGTEASSDSGGDASAMIGGVVSAILIVAVLIGVVVARKKRAVDADANVNADAKSPESTIALQGQNDRTTDRLVNEAFDHGNEEAMHGQPSTYEYEAGSTSESIYAVCDDDGFTNAATDKCAWQDNDGLPLRGQTRIGRGSFIQLEGHSTTSTTGDVPLNVYGVPVASNVSDVIYDNNPIDEPSSVYVVPIAGNGTADVIYDNNPIDEPNSVYVVPIAGNGTADAIYDNPTTSHEARRPSALIAETSFHTTTPEPMPYPSPRMRSDEERPSTVFEMPEFQIDASTSRVHAMSVKRQNPLRQETPTDAMPRLDGVVAVTETGLPGMPTRGMAGQPMEPDSVDTADPNDGYIDTVPGPSAYNVAALRQHSDL